MAERLGRGLPADRIRQRQRLKTRLLLDHLQSTGRLRADRHRATRTWNSRREHLADRYPGLEILPVCADFTGPLMLPETGAAARARRVVYFPGSTIGNFSPGAAVGLLAHGSPGSVGQEAGC